MPYLCSGKLQLHWLLQPRLGTRLPPAIPFGLKCQTNLYHYSNFFTESYGRTCLTFPFTCWKVFVKCHHPKLNKARKAMPSLTSLHGLRYSQCRRAALSCSVSFSRRQKGQKPWWVLWLPLWRMQWVADGRTCRLCMNWALYRHQVLILIAM